MVRETYYEACYWNSVSYGSAIVFSGSVLRKVNLFLAFVIVGFYPVPLALFINRFIKDFKVRY